MPFETAIAAGSSVIAIVGGAASLYMRASLASIEGRVAVLESQRVEDKESIRDMKQKIDSIYNWLIVERKEMR